jgi:hypothetical protein
MKVPAFLLRRLYVKGSLHNTEDGWAFDLKNSLGSGYAEAVRPLTLDGEPLPLESCRFVVDGNTLPFAEVSAQRPMTLGMNRTVNVEVSGEPLASGKHVIGIAFLVTGMGEMAFDVSDAIEGEPTAVEASHADA